MPLVLCAACGPPRFSNDDASEGSTEASSGTTSTTESSTNESTDTNDFLPIADIHGTVDCNPFQQDCAEGDKCVPYASSGGTWDANKCVPVLGSQSAGEPCTSDGIVEATDDCDATSFCWNVEEVDGEMLGTCFDFCQGSADMAECPEGYYCPISSDGAINLCFQTCDPIAQDCQDGFGCYWGGVAFTCIFTVEPGIADGQPCGYVNDCLPGSYCIDASFIPACTGPACCSPFCDLGLGDAQCATVPGTSCTPFWELGEAPRGDEHVGICTLAP
jgi:hypothetical protein